MSGKSNKIVQRSPPHGSIRWEGGREGGKRTLWSLSAGFLRMSKT